MGAFEYFLGYIVIPSMLAILALLALGGARRQVNQVVIHIVNASLNINGVPIKVLPCIAFINFIYFYGMLQKI